jgi:superfamily II DNA or RNA helicase
MLPLKNTITEDMPKNINSYLGQKGYTILKNELTIKQQCYIKDQLTVKPYVPGSPVQLQKSFPAYRESDKKLYIPRYYGEHLFGPAKTIKITEGDDINLAFEGSLRDYQIPVINKYLDHVQNGGGGLLELFCGWGKCLEIDTPIIMFDGSIKKVQDIVVGDVLMGDDSTPRNVLSLARGREQMYKITNTQGDSYTVNESHILSLKCFSNYGNKYKKGEIVDISVKDYLNLPKSFHGKKAPLLGYKVGINFSKINIDSDPYLFGFHLEDNLTNNKYIPHEYKCNDRQTRLNLLAGIIDSHGYIKGNGYEIIQKNNTLADDIVYLCRSLGFSCYSKIITKEKEKDEEYNRISIYGSGLENIPVLNEQKKISKKNQIKDSLVSRINIEKLEVDQYYGFCIDGNRRFLLGDFTVTHNTDSTLYTIGRLKKKTLIIVHKEFLMNQWIERIHKYYPTARIGKIQGQIIDIDNKDIVLAMLQSLSMKDYPSTLFDSFGFTIIDEVHHISSEVFSCALFKLVTKYTLGLSATMNRKDGTTKVFKMFLGEVVYKQERSKDENVVVRGITFQSKDEEFNELELDFRGQTAASKMLSKICNYNYRSEFILKILRDMIAENPKQQIMMIASYKNILSYMFDAIRHHNICSVGYYVGGMKESALKESESKQVVLATYSMAAEGLDIKSLTTLFMITPMTNIEQSVGRILRQKHEFAPIVVDIIDSHDNFQRQWMKRKSFYKKQNYKIIQTTSSIYDPDTNKWKLTYEPNNNYLTTKSCIKKEKKVSKTKTINSKSSTEDSEADDSEFSEDDDVEEDNDKNVGKCLLKFKK